MTREEVYDKCVSTLEKSDCLLLEAATGLGKSKISIDLINHLVATKYKGKQVSMLLLVAKTVHKQTWKDEIKKWGGLNVDNLTIECYESLRKHEFQNFTFIMLDEVHHVNSELRLGSLATLYYEYVIGLSATIPKKLKLYFGYNYHAKVVSCDLVEAIEEDILPEPQILLLPLQLDNTKPTETIEINPKAKGRTYYGSFDKLWTYRKAKYHAIISCTEKQKLHDMNSTILKAKNLYTRTRAEFHKNRWLHDCGERLLYLANLKNNTVKRILYHLAKERTITFCKSIEQAEYLGKYCIHSKNMDSTKIYDDFNAKKINHITAVNILNENANLVDCKYAIFANYASSDIVGVQRLGKL